MVEPGSGGDPVDRSRRRFSTWLGSGVAGMAASRALIGCAAPGRPPGVVVDVAPGIHMVRGADGEPGPANLGRVGNVGVIVGPSGVVVVDSGTSHAHGLDVLTAVAAITPLPIRRVVLTHARQEFIFGATAFRERGIPVTMHRRAARLMRSRCDRCLRNLQRSLGDDAMRGTAIVDPDDLVDGGLLLEDTGRPVRLLAFDRASGPGDLAVLDVGTGTLVAGGLLDVHRVPDVMDADLPGWRAALASLRTAAIARVVPGHGDAADASLAIDAVLGYLDALEACVRRLLDSGVPLSAVPRSADLPQYASWDLYGTLHRRNAAVVYLRLESEQLAESPGPATPAWS